MDDNVAFKFKVCLVGDPYVGKTSLIMRYVYSIFSEEYLKTIGTNVYKKSVSVDGARVQMIIWDIMGDHSFTSLIKDSYFYGAHGILAVYDVSRDFTRHNLERWSVLSESATFEGIPKVVLGNKVDLLHTKEDAAGGLKDIARKIGAGHGILTSAKTGEGVESAFQAIANLLVDYYKR